MHFKHSCRQMKCYALFPIIFHLEWHEWSLFFDFRIILMFYYVVRSSYYYYCEEKDENRYIKKRSINLLPPRGQNQYFRRPEEICIHKSASLLLCDDTILHVGKKLFFCVERSKNILVDFFCKRARRKNMINWFFNNHVCLQTFSKNDSYIFLSY